MNAKYESMQSAINISANKKAASIETPETPENASKPAIIAFSRHSPPLNYTKYSFCIVACIEKAYSDCGASHFYPLQLRSFLKAHPQPNHDAKSILKNLYQFNIFLGLDYKNKK